MPSNNAEVLDLVKGEVSNLNELEVFEGVISESSRQISDLLYISDLSEYYTGGKKGEVPIHDFSYDELCLFYKETKSNQLLSRLKDNFLENIPQKGLLKINRKTHYHLISMFYTYVSDNISEENFCPPNELLGRISKGEFEVIKEGLMNKLYYTLSQNETNKQLDSFQEIQEILMILGTVMDFITKKKKITSQIEDLAVYINKYCSVVIKKINKYSESINDNNNEEKYHVLSEGILRENALIQANLSDIFVCHGKTRAEIIQRYEYVCGSFDNFINIVDSLPGEKDDRVESLKKYRNLMATKNTLDKYFQLRKRESELSVAQTDELSEGEKFTLTPEESLEYNEALGSLVEYYNVKAGYIGEKSEQKVNDVNELIIDFSEKLLEGGEKAKELIFMIYYIVLYGDIKDEETLNLLLDTLGDEDIDDLIGSEYHLEFQRINKAITVSAFLLKRESKKNKELTEILEQTALTDSLTGIGNVRAFRSEFDKLISAEKRTGMTTHYLIMLDIDHFKYVNDTYGHAQGDKTLKKLVYIIGGALRGTDCVYRLGGEEFGILLQGEDIDDVKGFCNRLRQVLEGGQAGLFEDEHKITISLGISDVKGSAEDIYNKADKALYFAKENGRNQVVDFEGIKAYKKSCDCLNEDISCEVCSAA